LIKGDRQAGCALPNFGSSEAAVESSPFASSVVRFSGRHDAAELARNLRQAGCRKVASTSYASCLPEKRTTDEAIGELSTAASLDPKLAEAHSLLAIALIKRDCTIGPRVLLKKRSVST